LIHYPVQKLEDALSRMDRYSTASAEALGTAGRRVSFVAGIGHGMGAFLRTYVLRLGSSTRRGIFARRRQCRGQLLPLHESLARRASASKRTQVAISDQRRFACTLAAAGSTQSRRSPGFRCAQAGLLAGTGAGTISL